MGKILVAGLLGGILLFGWGAVVHMFLLADTPGIEACPAQEAVMATLKSNISQPGVYALATFETGAVPASLKEYETSIDGPHGLLVYQPAGKMEMSPMKMGIELASNVLAAIFVAFAVRGIVGGYFGRVAGAICFGVVAWLSISVSQWNWYEFTWEFVQVDLVDQVGGWFLAGLAIAAIAKPSHGA